MAEKEQRNEDVVQNYADPLYLGPSDHSQMQISSMIFNGNNFLNWSRSIKMSLASKNKEGFIDGTIKKPEEQDKNYHSWMRNDYMVRCWLFKSMNDKIAESLILCVTAQQLWEELKESYDESNAPQLYQLRKQLHKTEQGELTVSQYYCKIKTLWDEIQCLEEFPVCECDAIKNCKCNLNKKLNEMKNRNRLIEFLMGLDKKKYDGVIGNILSMDPLPTVSKGFHLVQQVEKQKEIAEGVDDINTSEVSAFNVAREGKQYVPKKDFKKEKMNKKCDYCGMRGHTKDGCFKLVGYPDWFKGPKTTKPGKFAAQVKKEYEADMDDNPIDAGSNEASTSNGGNEAGMINNVVQEVLRALNERQAANVVMSNFAGPF